MGDLTGLAPTTARAGTATQASAVCTAAYVGADEAANAPRMTYV